LVKTSFLHLEWYLLLVPLIQGKKSLISHDHNGLSNLPWNRKSSDISKIIEIPTSKPHIFLFFVSRDIRWYVGQDNMGWFHCPVTGSAQISPKWLKSPTLNHILCKSQPYPTQCHTSFGRLYNHLDYNYVLFNQFLNRYVRAQH
jgi:hypothetical protein